MSLVGEPLLVGGAAKVFWLRNVSKFRQTLTRFVKASLKIALSVTGGHLGFKCSEFSLGMSVKSTWGAREEAVRRRETKMAARNAFTGSRRSYGKNGGLLRGYLFSIGSF